MFRQLKNGKFAPHGQISQNSVMTEEIRKLVIDLSANISNQLYDNTGIATITHSGTTFTDAQLAAITELFAHELIYYHQLCEIGCFLASAFVDEENEVACTPRAPPSDDDSESEEEDPAPLFRSMSMSSATPRAAPAAAPKVNTLSGNLLAASGNIRKKIMDLFMKMAMPTEQFMLGAAGYANAHNETQQRYFHGSLVHAMFVRFGGGTFKRVEITSGMSPDQVLADIVDIAKSTWTLINLCGMCRAFQFAATETPLFSTIQIDPLESVFGNSGWKPTLQAATADLPIFRHWSDSVGSSLPQQPCASDDVGSSLPQQQPWASDDVGSSLPQQSWASNDSVAS